MKIRTGFVSNSSSQAFVIRGFEIDIKELIELAEIVVEEADSTGGYAYEVEQQLQARVKKFFPKDGYREQIEIKDTTDFFDGEDTGMVVIGQGLISLDDGVITRLPEPNDVAVRARLKAAIGKEITHPLSTYVQYISNDNY
jgi:hypothetical protein